MDGKSEATKTEDDDDKSQVDIKSENKKSDSTVNTKNGNNNKKNGSNTEKSGAAVKKDKNATNDDNDEEAEAQEDEGGMALGEIAVIDANITSNKGETLQTLHIIAYDQPGKTNMIKKNLRKFCGFEFDIKSEDYKKRVDATQKVDINKLKTTCEILNLDKKGTKEELSERICTFLMKPEGDAEQPEEDEEEPADEDEEMSEEEVKKPPPKGRAGRGGGGRESRDVKSSGGRPRRATAGRGFNRGILQIFS